MHVHVFRIRWGVEIDDPVAEFAKIDAGGGTAPSGYIEFLEFRDWALGKNLDLEDDDD